MSISIAKDAVQEYMEEKNDLNKVEFQFFGGEPFLNFELIKEVVEWFHTQTWHKEHLFFIGTNGTILNTEIKNWLLKYPKCVWVGVSIDGTKTAHDLTRSNSYDLVLANYSFFKEHYPTQPVKMTICKDSLPYVAESIIDLEEKNILFSANLVFENAWGDSESKQSLLSIYAHQLNILVDYYANRIELFPPRIISHDLRNIILEEKMLGTTITKRWCGTGNEMTMVDVDGKRFPCQRFSPWVTNRQFTTESINKEFINWKPEKCKYCRFINFCPTCAGHNFQENGDVDERSTFHCDFFKLELQASCKYFANTLNNFQESVFLKSKYSESQLRQLIDAIVLIESIGV